MAKDNTAKFLEELNIFRNEFLRAQRFFYTELTMREICNDKNMIDALNYSPDFWNTIFGALQHATFMTLGRIFDTDSKHNIHILIKIVENSKDIFKLEAFRGRWKANENWLEDYIKNFYNLTDVDFRNFKKFVSTQQKEYENIYKDVRHSFSHNKHDTNEELDEIFAKVNIEKLEKFCVKLGGIHEALWQLYHNGRGPMLPLKTNQEEASTKTILQNLERQDFPGPTNVQFIREAKNALGLVKIGFEKLKIKNL